MNFYVIWPLSSRDERQCKWKDLQRFIAVRKGKSGYHASVFVWANRTLIAFDCPDEITFCCLKQYFYKSIVNTRNGLSLSKWWTFDGIRFRAFVCSCNASVFSRVFCCISMTLHDTHFPVEGSWMGLEWFRMKKLMPHLKTLFPIRMVSRYQHMAKILFP